MSRYPNKSLDRANPRRTPIPRNLHHRRHNPENTNTHRPKLHGNNIQHPKTILQNIHTASKKTKRIQVIKHILFAITNKNKHPVLTSESIMLQYNCFLTRSQRAAKPVRDLVQLYGDPGLVDHYQKRQLMRNITSTIPFLRLSKTFISTYVDIYVDDI